MKTKNHIREIHAILNAKSIAVVGASANPEKWGYMTLKCLIDGGYEGRLFAVNQREDRILGVKTYPSVEALPSEVELFVMLVPAQSTPEILKQAERRGAKGAVILTSGFREAGRSDLEEGLLETAKRSGVRIVGPNIQGINYVPNKMCAVVTPLITREGRVGIVSQSGSVSGAIAEWAEKERLGISGLINVGNQVDLCESDFLDFFSEDVKTGVIGLYLEGPKNGSRFKESLSECAAKKPVVILKPGRTSAGKRAAMSHTASIAGDDQIFSCACRQFGAIRAESVESFYDTLKAFATLPHPAGRRVLIVTSSGGVGSLAVDELRRWGFENPGFDTALSDHLYGECHATGATYGNPLDIPSFDLEEWEKPMRMLLNHDVADILLFVIADAITGIEKVILDVAERTGKPIVVSFMGGGQAELSAKSALETHGIPVYPTPERAIHGLKNLTWYSEYRRKAVNDREK